MVDVEIKNDVNCGRRRHICTWLHRTQTHASTDTATTFTFSHITTLRSAYRGMWSMLQLYATSVVATSVHRTQQLFSLSYEHIQLHTCAQTHVPTLEQQWPLLVAQSSLEALNIAVVNVAIKCDIRRHRICAWFEHNECVEVVIV